MSDPNFPYLIGVDGGGTSCRIALLRNDQRFEVKLGSGNVAIDRSRAIATIRQGLDQVLAKANLMPADLMRCKIYMGLAGLMSDADSIDVAGSFPAGQIAVFNDRELAIPGALGDADGVVVSIGTGSFIGRRSKGVERYVGGWGFALDDAASGAWLGRLALRETLRVRDGFHQETTLTTEIMAGFNNCEADLVDFSLTAASAEFASYAPRVVALAAEKDDVGLRLMQLGADYICRSVDALGWQAKEPLCLIGGLGPHYSAYLPEHIATSIVEAKGNGLDAALMLAAKLGRDGAP